MTRFFSIGSWKLLRCCRNHLPGNERTNHFLTQARPWNLRRAGSFQSTFFESHSLEILLFLSYINEDHIYSSFMFITTFLWLIIFVTKFSKFLVVHSVTASLPYMTGVICCFITQWIFSSSNKLLFQILSNAAYLNILKIQ